MLSGIILTLLKGRVLAREQKFPALNFIMSDREIDEILEEIKRHAQQESASKNEAEKPAQGEPVYSNTIDEIMKLVNEKEEPAAKPEAAQPDETPIEEAPVEEAPVEDDEEIISIEGDEILSSDDDAAEEAAEEDIDFSISGEETAPEPEAEEEIVFTIPAEETAADEKTEAEDDNEVLELVDKVIEPQAEEEPEEEPPAQEEAPEEEPVALEDINLADFSSAKPEDDNFLDEFSEEDKPKSRKPLIIILSIILVLAIGAAVYFGFFYNKGNEAVTSTKPEASESTTINPDLGPLNPLTGEAGYNEAALGKRPVAVVVENEYSSSSVRPQWGLNKADIVLEGESEYSTRLLLFWADYTNMPAQIGSTRSARPPFIRFSQLFDAVFIHAGLSKSKGDYVGADTVFVQENVDHINLLNYSEDGTYFGRDKSRTSTIEHTGYLNGTNTAKLLEKAGINTTLNSAKFTNLEFNETPQALSDTVATSAKFIWSDVHSSGHCPKVGKFYYDTSLETYSTNDFDSDYGKADLEFENLIFLLDETEYIVKSNYKGSGNSETYCNYKLSGGKGTILSHGTALEITWGVSNGKLWMKDAQGNSVKLNPGKTYIGYGSSNKGGGVTLNYDTEN